MPVPAHTEGVVLALFDDFIGTTVVLSHAAVARTGLLEGTTTLCSVIGHVQVVDGLAVGATVTGGQIVGTVGCNTRTTAPHHLHLSLGWLRDAEATIDSWDAINKVVDLFDPEVYPGQGGAGTVQTSCDTSCTWGDYKGDTASWSPRRGIASPPITSTPPTTAAVPALSRGESRAGPAEATHAEPKTCPAMPSGGQHDSPATAPAAAATPVALLAHLPDVPLHVVLGHVFGSDARSARLVCSRWCEAVDGSRVAVRFGPTTTLDNMTALLRRCRATVTSIGVAGSPNALALVGWLRTERMLKQLRSLDLSHTAVDLDLVEMLRGHPSLALACTGAWRVIVPSPEHAPRQVLEAQLWALRERGWHKDGIDGAFRHASPHNQAYTGPASVFGTMIRLGYNDLLQWRWYSVVQVGPSPAGVADFEVLLGARDDHHFTSAYQWRLELQTAPDDEEAVDGVEGCWMVDGVLPVVFDNPLQRERRGQREIVRRSYTLLEHK
jgi:hypothetical protein